MSKRTSKAIATVPPPLPVIPERKRTPAELARERAQQAEIRRLLREIRDNLTTHDLNRAVVLAKMAARREGPLVEFFEKVGRQYRKLADEGPVVEGREARATALLPGQEHSGR
jgi:hypothetical protein